MAVYSPLEITIKSATDLEHVNHALKMEVFAVVSVCGSDNNNLNSREQRTPVDTDGHSNPKWNFSAKFNIDIVAAVQNQLTLVIKLKSVNLPNGEDDIGEVNVPIKSFLMDSFGHAEEDEKNVSYPVKTMAGEPKGELNFSYKLGKPSSREYQHVVPEPGYYGFLQSVYTVPPPYPPYPPYWPAVPLPYPPYGLTGPAAPSPYPPYGPAAPSPYPLYGHAAPPPYPPYGQAAPPPYPVPYGQAAPPPYPVAHEQTAPQMQPQKKPNLLAQLGIGVAAAVLGGAAQAGIGSLFSG